MTSRTGAVDAAARRKALSFWLDRLADATCSHASLHQVMSVLRDGIINGVGFDRVGIFLCNAEQGVIRGACGTDDAGKPVDTSDFWITFTSQDTDPICQVARGEIDYYLTPDHSRRIDVPHGHCMHGVRAHAQVPMRVRGSVVGVICVDNRMSDRPITEEDLADLLPFARHAALAVYTAELLDETLSAKETMLRAQKLRAVGELASGVAHNVNNVLAAVQGYTELILEDPSVTAEVRHYARIIERAVQDGAAMVRRIQYFARTETEVCALPLDLSQIAREAIDLTRPAWHTQAQADGIDIAVVTELTPGVQALGVASEIREVLVNLIRNAVDAMPGGGTLTLRCEAEDQECIVTVSDTGTGMSEETCQRIFEPFYTSKSRGRGIGLGLSVAWGIIARHGGRIGVESRIGHGTLFTIRLPRTEEAPICEAERNHDQTLAGLNVLLVEDEELVAGGIARILMANGAAPFLAQNAEEALGWLKMHADSCDIVLSDHGLTGCTGLNLLAQVRERYPRLRRVLLSGWGADLPGVTDSSAAELLLAKPIRQGELVSALLSLVNPPSNPEQLSA